MDVFNQYDVFKEKCFAFAEELEKKCFSQAKFICHPTQRNELICMCSDEEARSNGLNICRYSDMLLMSSDNEEWMSFNITRAREISAENGYVYLTDILAENAFYAEDWMINGKNDTIVVSEAYMREKGKRYAPVTPLTNKVLHFKKINNVFFWNKAEIGEIIVLDNEYIKNCIDTYLGKCVNEAPDFVDTAGLAFDLFDKQVIIDDKTTRILKTDVLFEQFDSIAAELDEAREIFESSEYSFSPIVFICEVCANVLANNGVSITCDEFISKYVDKYKNLSDEEFEKKLESIKIGGSRKDIIEIKLAFADALSKSDLFEYSYSSDTGEDYISLMKDLEQKDFVGAQGSAEEKFLISKILSFRPKSYGVFAYTLYKYPDQAENIQKLADFWNIAPMDKDSLQRVIFDSYLNAELFDEQGTFISGIKQAEIIKEELEKVNVKYGFENRSYIDELADYIKDADLRSRSYNGTVFDTPEAMKKAMANELEMQALCIDLSALNEDELHRLQKHIEGITVDDVTRSKYLIKVKMALNVVEESMLAQLCLPLPTLNADETIKLRDDVLKSGYAESVINEKLPDINNHLDTALAEELDKRIAKLDEMDTAEISILLQSVNSGRYPVVMAESYARKIENYADEKIKSEIDIICSGMDEFTLDMLQDAKLKLSSDKFPEKYTCSYIEEIDRLIVGYEQHEVDKLFENVDFATEEELENIKSVLSEKSYNDDLIAPYMIKVAQREQTLVDEELSAMCENIDDMDQEQLDGLRNRINSSSRNYNNELKEKCFDRIARREAELKNSELADRCKYIFSMNQDALNELKDVLLGDAYDESITTVYLKKVTEREDELRREELDELCANVSNMGIEELEKLRSEIADNSDYVAISDDYFAKIDNCIDSIKNAEYNKLLDTVDNMSESELESFKSDLSDKLADNDISLENFEKGVNKIAERASALEDKKLESIVGDLETIDTDKARYALDAINNGEFKEDKKAAYIEKLENRIKELHIEKLEGFTENIGDMSKEQLLEVKSNVENYGCALELKSKYIVKIDKAVSDLAEKEISEIVGNVKNLSTKKSIDIIVKLRTVALDESIKNKYLDMIEAHIMDMKNHEQRAYISFLKGKIDEFNVSTANFLVPTLSNLFVPKYDEACKNYISAGRYELPIFLHDNAGDNGFVLTTEYFHFINKGKFGRIKIDDIVSFQAKKSFVNTSVVVTERNGNTSEINCAINKNTIDGTVKAMTALVNFIKDQRSAEKMKDLLENAVKERTQEIAVAAVNAAAAAPDLEFSQSVTGTMQSEMPVDSAITEETAAETVLENESDNQQQIEENASGHTESATDTTEVNDEKPQEEALAVPKARFCDQCGAKITSPNAKFCAECGNKLS